MIRKDREIRQRTELELATLMVFESMATPEMVRIRDALVPAVLAWEEELEPWQTRERGPQPNSTAAHVLRYLSRNPGKTPGEIAREAGLDGNRVARACDYYHKTGALQRVSTGSVAHSGLTIWRYSLSEPG